MTLQQQAASRPVLLTGGTGVIGRALLGLTDLPVVALTHREDLFPRPGLLQLKGDLTRSCLGLDAKQYASVVSSAGAVLHAAAATDFDGEPRSIFNTNVAGTEQAIAVARAAGVPLVYVSSAFTARAETCKVVSGTGCASGRDAYLASKLRSEELVREAGLPYAIVRPSLLVGDSNSAEIARQQGLHTFLGAYCTGALPFLPFSETTPIDFVPSDIVAGALDRILRGQAPLGEYWLTSGEHAMRAGALAAKAAEVMADHGRALTPPRYFPVESVARLLLPAFFDTVPTRLRRRFENLTALASLFDGDRVFPSDLGALPLDPRPEWLVELPDVIGRTVHRFWAPSGPVASAAAPESSARVEAVALG